MNNRTKVSIALLLAVFGVWFYFTPHIAVSGMKSAAEKKDAEKLSDYVDFPALKESLKASLKARIASEVVKEKEDNPLAALGAAMGAALIAPMIDAIVTPESLAMIMKGDKPQPGKNSTPSEPAETDIDTSMSYESFDRFVVTVKKKGTTEEPLSLVFHRDGIFSWKLSALRLDM